MLSHIDIGIDIDMYTNTHKHALLFPGYVFL